ncbi:GGDEF domain-containing protein [Longimycelium tulufanense]|uniref:GGDEF domain-containing protein n=1 Tax=Longimycelium tulufanense TaxID=907463 RepID=A0A8J3CHE4_9PSEU|nr:GGDEF domain-containing protein [Longimycelium tulufanense]GGM66922.1 GGDEF domain-containing protein [Longimycelium tulufanense]
MLEWPLWTLRRPALYYWLAVDALAVAVVAAVALATPPPDSAEITRFGAIAVSSALVIVGTAVVNQMRREEQHNPWAIHVCYLVAGIFALPPSLLVLLLLGPALHGVLVLRPQPHRWMFTTAATALATFAARGVAGWDEPRRDVAMLILAGAAMLVVRGVIVAVGLRLRSPDGATADVLGNPIDVAVGVVAVCVGGMTAMIIDSEPVRALMAAAPMALLERAAQLPHWRRSAQRDAKTGLANAVHWDRLARDELSRANNRNFCAAVLLADLDHFKRVNDRYGHLAGDAALSAVAVLLRSSVRRGDLVGRFGGEEFVLILPDTAPTEAESVAQRLRLSVAALRVAATCADGQPIELAGLTISIGVATTERFGYELYDLLVAADSALLAAKGAGRNLVTVA